MEHTSLRHILSDSNAHYLPNHIAPLITSHHITSHYDHHIIHQTNVPISGRARVGPWLISFPSGDTRNNNDEMIRSGPPHRDFTSQTGEFVVLDRLGPRVLSTTFAAAPRTAAASISTSFAFTHYNAMEGINFTHIALPTISACMAALSTKPTISQLIAINRDLLTSMGRSNVKPYPCFLSPHLLPSLPLFFVSIFLSHMIV